MAKDQNNLTGIVVRGSYVEWTSLRMRKGSIEQAAQERADADLPDPVDLSQDDQADKLYKTLARASGEVSLALRSSLALLRVVDLPVAEDAEELEGMIELQVDKFAPFQMDRLQIAHEVLVPGEQTQRVLIAAVLRDHIEELGRPYLLHKASPVRVDLEVMGWWRLLKDHGDVQDVGRQVFLLLEPGGAELIVAQDGQPVLLRTLGSHEDVNEEEFIGEIVEETHYTLTSLESEWGAVHTPRLYLWYWGEAPGGIVNGLSEEGGLEVELRRFEDLPPLSEGIARRFVDTAGGLNLAPPDWKETRSSRALRKRILRASAVLLVLWAIGMIALTALTKLEAPRYEQRKVKVEALEGEAEVVRQLKDRLDELEQYADRTYSSLECLRETALLLPGGVDLNSFAYKKGDAVDLRGQSSSADLVYDYVEALERSALFGKVTPDDIRTRLKQGKRSTEFKIKALLPGGEE